MVSCRETRTNATPEIEFSPSINVITILINPKILGRDLTILCSIPFGLLFEKHFALNFYRKKTRNINQNKILLSIEMFATKPNQTKKLD